MEKKTMGGFLAALRKANGMTQKDLAERLNVSDKTVSRWERDDGTPDLSLIPVIAEVFGVTCDELLRGERKSPEEREEHGSEESARGKGEMQRQRLVKSALSHYQNLTGLSVGISLVGLLVALICNLAFLRASLGFLLGAIFYVAGIVLQVVLMNQAFSRVEDGELEENALAAYKQKVIALGEKSLGVALGLLGFTFPMVLVEAYYGLTAGSMLLQGVASAAIFLGIYAAALYFINASLVKNGTCRPERVEVYWKNHGLKGRCAGVLAVVLAVTLGIHAMGSALFWSTSTLAQADAVVFEDYDSFVAYMGRSVSSLGHNWVMEPVAEPGANSDDGVKHTLEDRNGEVVCTYIQRNWDVSTVSYTRGEGTVLPIRVITNGTYTRARQQSVMITGLYCLIYPVELLGAVWIYFRKRTK